MKPLQLGKEKEQGGNIWKHEPNETCTPQLGEVANFLEAYPRNASWTKREVSGDTY